QMTARLVQTFGFQLPDAFAAALRAVEEAGVFHQPQVLRDGLPGDRKAISELRNRHRPAVAQPSDESQTRFVAQCGEKRSGPRELRSRPCASCSSQGISQSV